MAKRHSDALAIQEGACNPSGIAHSIAHACQEIRGEPTCTGTALLTSDPAVKLMVHQLAFICGVTTGAEGMAREPDWDACMQTCRAVIKGWVKFEPGQPVTPPDDTTDWWYHKDAPDGDWYRTADLSQAVQATAPEQQA